MRKPKRLIFSFIGYADVNHIEGDAQNMSPIVRLLMHLSNLQPRVPPADTQLGLFDDDEPGTTERAEFVEKLRRTRASLGLQGLDIPDPVKVHLPDGATDLDTLHAQVWEAVDKLQAARCPEVFFHVSSGTWAMQVTLLLAANCLPLKQVRLFETSNKKGKSVLELRPPYVLAARETGRGGRTRGGPLPAKARQSLIAHTIIDDSQAEAAYLALHRGATGSGLPPRILLLGATGSGKWHACRQFVRWRGADEIAVCDPARAPAPAAIPEKASVLAWRIDAWGEAGLGWLAALGVQRPDVAIAATFRTDRATADKRQAVLTDGLCGAAHVHLPALGIRSDIVALGKALTRRAGKLDGKVDTRLSYDLIGGIYPRGLHDLNTQIATGALLGGGKHIERDGFRRAAAVLAAGDALDEAYRVAASLHLDGEHFPLGHVLENLEKAVIARARACGMTQGAVEALTGASQSEVSRIEQRHYHALLPADGGGKGDADGES